MQNSEIHSIQHLDPRNIAKYKDNLEKFSLKYKPKFETNPIGTIRIRFTPFDKFLRR